jgi:hypothetical protein
MAESIQRPSRFAGALAVLLLVAGLPARPAAHDIPASVVVQVFARPEGRTLRVILRTPLVSMRDFTFPSKDGTLLDLTRIAAMLGNVTRTWIVPGLTIYEDDRALEAPTLVATRISLPSDGAFGNYQTAESHLKGPGLAADTALPVTEAMLDVMLDYPIASDRARFSIDPRFARFGIRVVTTLRFLLPGQAERAFQFTGDPGLVRLDPRWHQAAWRFVQSGFAHILDGIDHLLFLFCLVLPIRRFWQLFGVVTAFTAAHSITLFCAAFGLAPGALWFPPLVETLIAVSILYMALENIVGLAHRSLGEGGSIGSGGFQHRWIVAFGFGLVHGFGFSFALQDTLQFAGSHLVTSLLSFNVGVELGQLLVLAILIPVLSLTFRFVVGERIGVIIASALVAHTAWHWMTERGATLGEYDWSIGGAAGVATLLRWLMAAVGVAGAAWLVTTLRSRNRSPKKSMDR